MNNPIIRYIFLIHRSAKGTLILHPFRAGDDLFRNPERLVLHGRYGTEPDAASSESLRSVLHAELEKGARADALERGFYFRLFASALVFMILYLFLSIFVRDPVPLVDELLVGGLGAFAFWFAMERRVLSAPVFSERLAVVRKALDTAIFSSSPVANALEESLQDVESLEPGSLEGLLTSDFQHDVTDTERQELSAVEDALETHIPSETAAEVRRLLSQRADPAFLIQKILGHRKVDLPMLLSYARIHALLKEKR